MKKFIIMVFISLLVGCTGVDTLRISSVPDQAKVYVDGVYAGFTPYSLRTDWYTVLGVPVAGSLHLTIDKEGYKTIEKDISGTERKDRRRSGNHLYTFSLEPLQSK
jgi:hypothetical protein